MDDEQEQEVQGETKEQRFKRLATKRTQAALQKIRLLENLSGSSYRYTLEQADTIVGALRTAVDAVETKFNRADGRKKSDSGFSL